MDNNIFDDLPPLPGAEGVNEYDVTSTQQFEPSGVNELRKVEMPIEFFDQPKAAKVKKTNFVKLRSSAGELFKQLHPTDQEQLQAEYDAYMIVGDNELSQQDNEERFGKLRRKIRVALAWRQHYKKKQVQKGFVKDILRRIKDALPLKIDKIGEDEKQLKELTDTKPKDDDELENVGRELYALYKRINQKIKAQHGTKPPKKKSTKRRFEETAAAGDITRKYEAAAAEFERLVRSLPETQKTNMNNAKDVCVGKLSQAELDCLEIPIKIAALNAEIESLKREISEKTQKLNPSQQEKKEIQKLRESGRNVVKKLQAATDSLAKCGKLASTWELERKTACLNTYIKQMRRSLRDNIRQAVEYNTGRIQKALEAKYYDEDVKKFVNEQIGKNTPTEDEYAAVSNCSNLRKQYRSALTKHNAKKNDRNREVLLKQITEEYNSKFRSKGSLCRAPKRKNARLAAIADQLETNVANVETIKEIINGLTEQKQTFEIKDQKTFDANSFQNEHYNQMAAKTALAVKFQLARLDFWDTVKDEQLDSTTGEYKQLRLTPATALQEYKQAQYPREQIKQLKKLRDKYDRVGKGGLGLA
jgi:hypothetical protein